EYMGRIRLPRRTRVWRRSADESHQHLSADRVRAQLSLRQFVLAAAIAQECREWRDRDSTPPRSKVIPPAWWTPGARVSLNANQARGSSCPLSARRHARRDDRPPTQRPDPV